MINMAWLSFGLFVVAAIIATAECRAVPVEPLAIVMGPNGTPIMMMRTKRQPIPAVPKRAMMFTGYYRPTRDSNDGTATGVFAQGNAVSGGSYLAGDDPNYLKSGPEPAEEPDVTSSEAEAAPENGSNNDEQNYSNTRDGEAQEEPQQDEVQPFAPEAPAADEPIVPQTTAAKRPTKTNKSKKPNNKKTLVHVEDDPQIADDDDDEVESDEEAPSPFVPFKGNHRGQMPNLNNFFPMVFNIPSGYGRRGSNNEGSPPGMITAIANSYSMAKGGIASSVATAYGGPSQGKKKSKSSQE